MYMYMYIYIYICIERERYHMYVCMYIYIYICDFPNDKLYLGWGYLMTGLDTPATGSTIDATAAA